MRAFGEEKLYGVGKRDGEEESAELRRFSVSGDEEVRAAEDSGGVYEYINCRGGGEGTGRDRVSWGREAVHKEFRLIDRKRELGERRAETSGIRNLGMEELLHRVAPNLFWEGRGGKKKV